MTLQTSAPLAKLPTTATHRSVRELVRTANEGQMTLNAPYQRGSVWTLRQRIGLIRSWLQGVPIPAVVINDRGTPGWAKVNGYPDVDEPLYAVIDGKQRIETAMAWMAGEFAVPASWWQADMVGQAEDTDDGSYVRYTGLTQTGRRIFDREATIAVCEGQLTSVEEEAAVFSLVNGEGTPMTSADMERAAKIAR